MATTTSTLPAALPAQNASAKSQSAQIAQAHKAPQDSVSPAHMVAFLAMVFGMFMAILDIQVVSASLAEIQAGLSASADEITWVQTSYLIAEVVMIPLSGYLSRALSTRYIFVISSAGFTIMSFFCAQATSLEEMIVFRALQGFIGGGMIPTVFATAYTIFPPRQRAMVGPLIGLVATLAPTIGPTVGGYLTDLFSWKWLFLINVGPGIIVTITTWIMVDFDKPDFSLLKNFDWTGLISMAGMLGGLEYMLEEGPSKDWFANDLVLTCAIIAGISSIVFFIRVLSTAQPIVDLRAFKDRNFWTGSLFSFIMGIGLYGLTYLYPVYLARVRGYSSLQIGETMFVTGLCMFFTAPIVGKLSTKIDPRFLIAAGFAGFAVGTWQASFITHDWDFYELLAPQILRGVSLMTCMLPINNIALGTLPPQRIKNASGLFNLTRNLGGAFGLALINQLLNDRTDLHLARLHEAVNAGNTTATTFLHNLTQAYSPLGSHAGDAALKKLTMLVHREAVVMALGDVFFVLTLLFSSLVIFAFLMRKPQMAGGGGGH